MCRRNELKLVFVSNYFSHHQKALSDGLADQCDYSFVEMSEMTEERKNMGWGMDKIPGYVCSYAEAPDEALDKIARADVVIAGDVPPRIIRDCLRRNQVVLRYSERPLKNGMEPLKYLPRLIKWHCQNPLGKRIYLLCASAYTARDYAAFGLFRGKAYRWGYFPEVKNYKSIQQLIQDKKKVSILWVGRFLDWKHPDDAIAVAARLKASGYSFDLRMIGSGPMEDALREQIWQEGLEDCVHLLGTMSPEQVRTHMEKTEIFLFTSGRHEGWGAVLNEAMNSGCCVVACEAAGSVPYLVRNGCNGLTYRFGDKDSLYDQVRRVLDTEGMAAGLGAEAYETMVTHWNGKTAAERLVALVREILAGKKYPDLYPEGPCSKETIQ